MRLSETRWFAVALLSAGAAFAATGCVEISLVVSTTTATAPTSTTMIAATVIDATNVLMAQQNPRKLSRDITVGGGPLVADLAHSLDVDPAALGPKLREHRHELVPLLAEPVSDERAEQFATRVRQIAEDL